MQRNTERLILSMGEDKDHLQCTCKDTKNRGKYLSRAE